MKQSSTAESVKERVEYLQFMAGLPFITQETYDSEGGKIGLYVGNIAKSVMVGENYFSNPKVYALIDFSFGRLKDSMKEFPLEEIIPVLYPLTSITDEHCIELALADGFDHKVISGRPDAVVSNIKALFNMRKVDMMLSSRMWAWLVHHGYDVMGWIETGAAIDRTKTKIPVYEREEK